MPLLQSILTFLQLGRVGLIFTAISNAWLVIFISKIMQDEPRHAIDAIRLYTTNELLALTTVIAGGMYLFGMVSNDIFDAKRDVSFAPNRPIPSGRVSITWTIIIAIVSLLIAIVASFPLGWHSVVAAIATALMILFYNSVGKYLPAVGVLTLGLIRASHMLIVNPLLAFCWPVWLILTHILLISTIAHRLEGKRPIMNGAEILTVLAGWVFLSMMLVVWMTYRQALGFNGSTIWAGPIIASIIFAIVATFTWKQAKSKPQAGGLLMKRGLIWIMIYDASWMIAGAYTKQALILIALIPAAYITMWFTGFLKKILTPVELESKSG